MRSPFNPVRRSRNIGTAKQGHGQSNRLTIPDIATSSRRWAERLNPHDQLQRVVGGREVIFFVERTAGDCAHACSVEDIRHVLIHLPMEDWEGLDTFVLRQSTRKQRLLAPAWGRLFYHADLGIADRTAKRCGPAVFLEAFEVGAKLEWPSALQPDDAEELERLRDDGHLIHRVGRSHAFVLESNAVRATQLYRTLLHEIGHWVDWLNKVERPVAAGAPFDTLCEDYFKRPKSEREAFAHRYADEMHKRLRRFGVIPSESLPSLTI